MFNFNVDDAPVSENSYDLIPEGWYQVEITKSELKDTKDGTGKLISLGYKITGQSSAGRLVFGNINVSNKNTEAERIGREQLGALMRAVNVANINNGQVNVFIGTQLLIKVGIKAQQTDKNTGKVYDAQNEPKGFKPLAYATPSASSLTQSQPSAKPKKPWEK